MGSGSEQKVQEESSMTSQAGPLNLLYFSYSHPPWYFQVGKGGISRSENLSKGTEPVKGQPSL